VVEPKLRAVSDEAVEVARAAKASIDALGDELRAFRERVQAAEATPLPKNAEGSIMRIVSGVLVAAMIGAFAFLWSINARLATIEAALIELRSRPVPGSEVTFRLGDHERRLDIVERVTNGGPRP
jgi:hypothetical protein